MKKPFKKSVIARMASRYLKPMLLVLSLIVLFRGHHDPGGGFIAALLTVSAMTFDAITGDDTKTYSHLVVKPVWIMAGGMFFCLLAAISGFFSGQPVLSGQWATLDIPLTGAISLGTPTLFDLGVYGVVTGSLLMSVFFILEETEWK